jgi:hypothetical protein
MFVGIACCQADSTKGVLFFCDQRISEKTPPHLILSPAGRYMFSLTGLAFVPVLLSELA